MIRCALASAPSGNCRHACTAQCSPCTPSHMPYCGAGDISHGPPCAVYTQPCQRLGCSITPHLGLGACWLPTKPAAGDVRTCAHACQNAFVRNMAPTWHVQVTCSGTVTQDVYIAHHSDLLPLQFRSGRSARCKEAAFLLHHVPKSAGAL